MSALKTILALLCGSLAAAGASGAEVPSPGERAMSHVRNLAALGERVAGGAGEAKAAAYVREQMERAGLKVSLEPFEFQAYAFERAVLTAGGERVDVLRLAFDPYTGDGRTAGPLVFVDPGGGMRAALQMEMDGRIAATTAGANIFALGILKKPRAIAVVSDADFARLRAAAPAEGAIAATGRMTTVRSANVVGATAAAGRGREIIVSAHYDSWRGPGAGDNASGVAVLLELARSFAMSGTAPAIRFVAFGAEEMGLMGAKAYLDRHRDELQRCRLLFNIDSVGGAGPVIADTRGALRQAQARVESRLPAALTARAANDVDGRWMLLDPGLAALFDGPNVPEWLRTAVAEAGAELGLEMRTSSGMGSDHRVFVQAGVPATNIAIPGPGGHTADDVAEKIHPESLEKAARVVGNVIGKALKD